MNQTNIRIVISDIDGVLTDGMVYMSDEGRASLCFNVRDGHAIERLKQRGLLTGIVSHSRYPTIVGARAKQLGVDFVHCGPGDKESVISAWLSELELDWDNVAFIGDELADLTAIRKSAFSACPADAVEEVKHEVDLVLAANGGGGCLRELAAAIFPNDLKPV